MSPYREQGPGAPSGDPLEITPGKGLRGIWVGRATVEDVLVEFGDDCGIYKYDNGNVYSLEYSSGPDRELDGDRLAQHARPATFNFEFGLLDEIHVGRQTRKAPTCRKTGFCLCFWRWLLSPLP